MKWTPGASILIQVNTSNYNFFGILHQTLSTANFHSICEMPHIGALIQGRWYVHVLSLLASTLACSEVRARTRTDLFDT